MTRKGKKKRRFPFTKEIFSPFKNLNISELILKETYNSEMYIHIHMQIMRMPTMYKVYSECFACCVGDINVS